MKRIGKLFRRAGAPAIAVAILLAAVVYLAYPAGAPTRPLSNNSAGANASGLQSLNDTSNMVKPLPAGGGTAAGGLTTSAADNSSITVTQTQTGQSAGGSLPAPGSPQTAVPPPQSQPQPKPIQYPCNSCVPGAGHVCPMVEGAVTPGFMCAPCGAYPVAGSSIACRLE